MKKVLKPRHIGETAFKKMFAQFLRESIEIMRKARRETHEKYPDLFDHAKEKTKKTP